MSLKISIITACYNNEKTITDTLESITNQTYNNIEHIIINGASTDNTIDIINKYKTDNTIIISEPDNGIYDALNKGIKIATGDIIGFLHADDIFFNNLVIENIANVFNTNIIDAVYGNLQYVSKENTNNIIRNWISSPFTISKLKKGWMPAHPTLYLKKDIYNQYGYFDLDYKIAADYDFMLRIFSKNIISYFLPEYFIKMRIGGKSNSIKNLTNKMKEDLNALKKNSVGGIYSLFLKNITKLPQFLK